MTDTDDGQRALGRTVKQWLPYVGLGAAFSLLGFVVGAALGMEGIDPLSAPYPAPGGTGNVQSVGSTFGHDLGIAIFVIAGLVAGLAPTVFLLTFEGFAIGGVVAEAVVADGLGTSVSVLGPRLVFQLPAYWVAGGIAFRWAHVMWRIGDEQELPASVRQVGHQTIVGVVLIVLLTALAAIGQTAL